MNKQKEEYKQMRKSGQFRLEWFYEYYIRKYEELSQEKNYKHRLNYEEFHNIFQMYLQQTADNVLNYLDGIFGIHILTDVNGKFIKVID